MFPSTARNAVEFWKNFSYISTHIDVFIRVLIDATLNQVPSLINPIEKHMYMYNQLSENGNITKHLKKQRCTKGPARFGLYSAFSQ